MKGCFVDTNLFVRYLTNDDPVKADRVEYLLGEAAAGKVRLVTAEIVMAELVWVLESCYDLSPAQIAPLIRGILATPGLEVMNASLVEKALVPYASRNVDFIDGYIAAVMEKQGMTRLYSFDRKHVARLEAIERMEP